MISEGRWDNADMNSENGGGLEGRDGWRKEEGGRRKEEGGRRKRKEEGGEPGNSTAREEGVGLWCVACRTAPQSTGGV